jgi:dTDP-4-dehydrorhamnose 3,5-epimerase
MKFTPTKIPGLFVLEIEYVEDERGFFARTWDDKVGEAATLVPAHMVQHSTSFNPHKGTLRGMHFQKAPHAEAKIVRCTRGAMYDVAIDLRKDSLTYLQSVAVELTEDNRRGFYISEGFAHGFQSLTDNSEMLYMMSAYFVESAGSGVRYNDPAFAIEWPEKPTFISERDTAWPDWQI